MLSAAELQAERRLIEASQKEPRRFARLYEKYFDRVYAFAMTRTHDHAAAEDVTSETFRRALQNLPRFQWRGVPFSAWLFRIAANAAADQHKQAAPQTGLDDLPDEPSDSWDAAFIQVEERSELFALVGRLPRDQQAVIAMRFAQDKSTQEIALVMGRSDGAVKQLQFRALQSLRAWVGESYE
jgi:RNA polymerase sigma-70 factor (ECF subfamily)